MPRPVLIWMKQGNSGDHWERAFSNRLPIGSVGQRSDGSVFWQIDAVFMKWIARGDGETTSIPNAKRALGRSWSKWLKMAGLG